jgi:hypothetical protein
VELLIGFASACPAVLEVGDARGLDRADLFEAGTRGRLAEEPRAGAEQDRDDVDPHLIDEAGSDVLLDRLRAAADRDVLFPAAAVACSRADSIPSLTKWKVVPPSISSGSRAW